jgi:hypothetical protein
VSPVTVEDATYAAFLALRAAVVRVPTDIE